MGMAESPKGSIFSSLRALEEIPEETPAAPPTSQNPSPSPTPAAQTPTPTPPPSQAPPPSDETLKAVESKIEKLEQKIQEMGTVPNSDPHLNRIEALEQKLQQMQERAIQAEVALREREKSQEAARRETESLLQNLASQRRLEESDRQMKENLAYCRRRIEELEEKQSSIKIPDTQQSENEFKSLLKSFMEQIELKTTPVLASLVDLRKENENREKENRGMEQRINEIEKNINSFFSTELGQASALAEGLRHLKQTVERVNTETAEKLEKISAALSLLEFRHSQAKNTTEELRALDKDFQKILSILDASVSNSPK